MFPQVAFEVFFIPGALIGLVLWCLGQLIRLIGNVFETKSHIIDGLLACQAAELRLNTSPNLVFSSALSCLVLVLSCLTFD